MLWKKWLPSCLLGYAFMNLEQIYRQFYQISPGSTYGEIWRNLFWVSDVQLFILKLSHNFSFEIQPKQQVLHI